MKKSIYYLITILVLGFTSCDQEEDYTETLYSFDIYNDSSTDSLWVKYKIAPEMTFASCWLPDGTHCGEQGERILTTRAVANGISADYETVEMSMFDKGLHDTKIKSDTDLKELIQTLEVYTINGTDTLLAIPSSYFKKLDNWRYSYSVKDKKTNVEWRRNSYGITITDDMLKQ